MSHISVLDIWLFSLPFLKLESNGSSDIIENKKVKGIWGDKSK